MALCSIHSYQPRNILISRKAVNASKRMPPTHVDFVFSNQIGENE